MTDLNNDQQTGGDDFDAIAAIGSAAFLAQQAGQPPEVNPGETESAPPPDAGNEITNGTDGVVASGNGNEVVSAGQDAQSSLDWSKVSPEFRAAFEAARKQADEGLQYRRSNEGRVTAYQRRYENAERELAAFRAATAAPVSRGIDPDAALAKVRAVTQDYPELAPIAEAVQAIAERNRAAETRFAQMDAMQQQAALDNNAAALDQIHPGWDRDLASPAFQQWFQSAPDFIQQAVRQNGDGIRDVNAAAYIVSMFKAQTGPTQAAPIHNPTANRRQQQLAGATSVRAGGRGAADGPPVDDFDANWEHFARRGTNPGR